MRILKSFVEWARSRPRRAVAALALSAAATVAVAAATLAPTAPAEPPPRVVGYSEFRKMASDGKLAEATVGPESVDAVDVDGGRVRLNHDGWLFRTELPRELTEAGVDVKFPEEAGRTAGQVFVSVVGVVFPMVMLGVFGLVGVFMWTQVRHAFPRGWPQAFEGHPVRFADVAGQDEPKFELEEVKAFLSAPGEYARLGAKAPRGVLMVGPPGTGKTLLAKALAGEAGASFIAVTGSDFSNMYVGVGRNRMEALFKKARKMAPCIVFIDEIDSVARRRGASGSDLSRESDTTLNQLLVEMDGFRAETGVTVIGATNRVDVLDPAILRPGRFDRQVHVGLPDLAGREGVLAVHARGRVVDGDVDFRTVARGTPGFSGADIENLVNEAAILAARERAPTVAARHFESARDKVLMGLQRRSLMLSDDERRLIAVHEAGHALVACMSPASDPVHQATIVPRGQSLGLVMRLPERDRVSVPRRKLEADLAVAMAGRAAEEVVLGDGNVTTGAASDIEHATSLARCMVFEWGMSPAIGMVRLEAKDGSAGELADGEVRRIVEEAYGRAKRILEERREALDALAAALLDRESLSGDEVRAIAGTAPGDMRDPAD